MDPQRMRKVSDADWQQLITLAAGFLPLENGDIKAAMTRAVAAHAELIRALKEESISADVGPGRVTLFVPPEGGLAVRTERHAPSAAPPPAPLTPPAPAFPGPFGEADDEPTQTFAPPGASRSTFYMDEDETGS